MKKDNKFQHKWLTDADIAHTVKKPESGLYVTLTTKQCSVGFAGFTMHVNHLTNPKSGTQSPTPAARHQLQKVI